MCQNVWRVFVEEDVDAEKVVRYLHARVVPHAQSNPLSTQTSARCVSHTGKTFVVYHKE